MRAPYNNKLSVDWHRSKRCIFIFKVTTLKCKHGSHIFGLTNFPDYFFFIIFSVFYLMNSANTKIYLTSTFQLKIRIIWVKFPNRKMCSYFPGFPVHVGTMTLADLGGRPPYGSRFFRFDMQNFRNVAASGVHGPPPTRSTPPYGKSWIRHCMIIISLTSEHQNNHTFTNRELFTVKPTCHR